MSDRSMWKMLHLLYTLRPGQTGLTDQQLDAAGVDCGPDTIFPFEASGVVIRQGATYSLSECARRILGSCVVANRRWSGDDMWVDHPSAFVIMPFGEPWSSAVFQDLIAAGARAAGLDCVRGDMIVRVGDLGRNIWGALLRAGIIIADVSALNANVFYELGLAHALGKDTVILRQRGSAIPADIGGAHYHEYVLDDLDAGAQWLANELRTWSADNRSAAVRALLGR
jgi:hypothetical protein